jgi:hypothetical protein
VDKHHAAITSNVEVELTGTDVGFDGGFGTYECNTISKVDFDTTNSSTTGRITTFKPDGKSTEKSVCKGTGAQAQCEVHDFTPHGLPWVIHTVGKNAAGEGTVSVTTGTITTQNTGFLCVSPDYTPGTLHVSVAAAQINTTSTGNLAGSLVTDPGGAVAVGGTVHFLGVVTYGV